MTNKDTEKRLWDIANDLRANSKLSSAEYSTPVLGLIFLRHADFKFSIIEKRLEKKKTSSRRHISKLDYQAEGALYLPEKARYSYLLNLPEKSDFGKALDSAMDSIEKENPDLRGTLPRGYSKFANELLVTLLKAFSKIETEGIEGDVFGKIYEYFLGEFAMNEGQKGGEFFTPTALVKLIVEVIEPFHGQILDPACGSGGMFVQSAKFIEEHKKNPSEELSIYGQERVTGTVNLCKMNLAVHGLSGDIRETNSYYEDIHKSVGKFDFVMANPPFNVKKVDYSKIKKDPRWPFGVPSTDNANYLWIQAFYSALNKKGRAGFVMGNSASDARGSELEIRKNLVQANAVDVMISIGTNFFYTVILPCTLWFFDKAKANTNRKGKILFIDARNIFTQVDRAHREFTVEQIKRISDVVKSYREEKGAKKYKDILGFCKVTSLKEIEKKGWSLNPGIYVGITEKHEEKFDPNEKLKELKKNLERLRREAGGLENNIAKNSVDFFEKNRKISNFKKVRLKEIAEFQYGYTASADEKPVGPKFLRITDIVPDHIDWASVPYCPITDDEFKKYKLFENDIVVARTGATAGFAKLIKNPPDSVFASYLIRIRVGNGCDSRYVGKIIESDKFKEFIDKNKGGSAQPHANVPVIERFELHLPPLSIQKKIGIAIDNYCGLIENNIRQIKTLEQMAQITVTGGLS